MTLLYTILSSCNAAQEVCYARTGYRFEHPEIAALLLGIAGAYVLALKYRGGAGNRE